MDYTVTEHMQRLLDSDEDYEGLSNYYKTKYKENPREFGRYGYKRFYIKGAIECEAYKYAHIMITSYLKSSDKDTLKIIYEDLGDLDYAFATQKAKHKDFWLNRSVKNFEQAIKLGNSHVELYYKIARAYDKLNLNDKAIRYCKTAIEKDSSYYSAYYLKAELYENVEQYDDALQTFKDLKNRFEKENIYYSVGKIYEHKGDINKAINAYQNGYEEDEDKDDYYIYRSEIAACYEKMEDYKNALKVYNSIIKDKSGNVYRNTYFCNKTAALCVRIGDVKKGIKYYQKTLKTRVNKESPNYNRCVAYKELSNIYYGKKDYKKALRYANKALELYRKYMKLWEMQESDTDFAFVADCYIFIANAAVPLKLYTKAINGYNKVLEYIQYMDKEQYGPWMEKAVPNINMAIGEIYIRLSKMEKAQEYLNKYPQEQTYPEYNLCMAEIAYRNNDKAKTKYYYKKFKELKSDAKFDKEDLLAFTFLKDFVVVK